ncbi:MAG TPA: PEPxxWA-CTERM sorting domain-containing protein [Phenylobacterium sp.]|jgi:hypothetical protein|uniref:PEPxxWA-CTERM sorting domain-containing protein n=1 Tax=Phenylobacterium sp. TaxID=1871053 RepID=UPI002B957DEE|nr:PEPxxWA-CTERM sorting domain-containing protein [Phenylobacterium sp.]HXA38392.1 PEPxxWA-CTERM sorting domain-containing protein [Phenylobacterium sp.]
MTLRALAAAAAAALVAGTTLSAGRAEAAGQVSIQIFGDPIINVDECTDGCQLSLLFQVRNNGLVNSVISLGLMTTTVEGVPGTDITNDVLTAGPTGQAFPGSCGTALEAFQSCFINAQFNVVDADPFDQDHDDAHADWGAWLVQLHVPWVVPQPPCDPARSPTGDVCSGTQASPFYDVHVNDDRAPVPEPGAWALLILGAGLAGAALRRRRAVVAA